MIHAVPNVFNVIDWDYRIDDGHIPARGANAGKQRLAVVSGMFDYNWRYAETLAIQGDAQIRTSGRVIRAPNRKLVIDPAVLAGTPAGSSPGWTGGFVSRIRWQAVAESEGGRDRAAGRESVGVLHRGEQLHAGIPAETPGFTSCGATTAMNSRGSGCRSLVENRLARVDEQPAEGADQEQAT